MEGIAMSVGARKKRRRTVLEYTLKYGLIGILLLVLLFPYAFMVLKSLMSIVDVNAAVVRFFPSELHFENYKIFIDYIGYFLNSLIVVAINGVFVPLSACLVAYPLARHKFTGKKLIFGVILGTCMIPASVIQIPLYTLFVQMGLYDTLASQYIGAFFGGTGMQIFLIIQFIRAIPKEFDQAAMIDGANRFQIFARILLPLCVNVCLFLGISMVIAKWNDFQGPLIYLSTDSKFTVAAAFYWHFSSVGDASLLTHQKMAMAVCMTAFPALLFFCFQDQMIGGVKIGGLKG